MKKTGLILEGGGMRGVYTAGVLDFFLDQKLSFNSCYAVSAGACHATSFLSGQRGRAFAVNTDYLGDKRYCSIRSLLTTGDLFGVKFVYDTVPNELNRYDYEAFLQNPCRFFAVVTNCKTGKAEYLPIRDLHTDVIAIRASSSLPLLARRVPIGEQEYLDGGIADSIPLAQAMKAGSDKNVIVLTQSADYRKEPNRMMPFIKLRYYRYPALVSAAATRHLRYNAALDLVHAQQKLGSAFVIQPSTPVSVGRVEKDREKLRALYQQGYDDAKASYPALLEFLSR